MPTEKQIQANRLNALKSTGPKSPAGKARSARNALKHGLLTRDVLMPGEKAKELMAFLGACRRLHAGLRRLRFWPQARSVEEAMQRRASLTTRDTACGQKSRRPFGLRRQQAVCGVASPQRCAPLYRLRRRALHPARCRQHRSPRGFSDRLPQEMVAELAPQGELEEFLADRVVESAWRLRRAGRMERQIVQDKLSSELRSRAKSPGYQESQPVPTADSVAASAPSNKDTYDKLVRYEAHIQRGF